METIIATIVKVLSRMSFIAIIPEYQEAVLLRCGRERDVLGPGFHFKIPILDDLLRVDVIDQSVDLPDQYLDDWSVSGGVEYAVVDVRQAQLIKMDVDQTIQLVAMGVIAEEFTPDVGALKEKVFTALSGQAEEWGLEIKNVWITHMSQNIVLHHVNGVGTGSYDDE